MNVEEKWYKDGLRFQCTGCGKCCTGSPGVVWVSGEEEKEIAAFLGISLHDFQKRYTKLIGEGKRVLREIGKEWDCIFLEGKKKCFIYPVRPQQCKTFPWWKGVLCSKEQWRQTGEYCEGVDHPDAPLFSQEEIDQRLHSE
jgi:Fe-S-cluster containining protein